MTSVWKDEAWWQEKLAGFPGDLPNFIWHHPEAATERMQWLEARPPVQPTEPVSPYCDSQGFKHGKGLVKPTEPAAWLPSDELLDAIDDDDYTGKRPCPLSATIKQVRELKARLAHPPVAPAAFDLLVRTKVAIENSPGYFNKRMQEFVCLLQEWIDYACPPVQPTSREWMGETLWVNATMTSWSLRKRRLPKCT